MEAVPTATEHYSIVSQPSAADICIVPWGEYITYELAQVLRPLTRKDVETITRCCWRESFPLRNDGQERQTALGGELLG
jgi:hypothetical protein